MPPPTARLLSILLPLLLFCVSALGHPLPDIPVRAEFEPGNRCRIQVEVDPRCFDADPNIAPSMLPEGLKELTEGERAALKAQAEAYVRKAVALIFEPHGPQSPGFAFDFTAQGGGPLANADDVVVLTGTWQTTLPAGTQGYRIQALPEGTLSVVFLNTLGGKKVERFQVLFPGETSYILDLANLNAAAAPSKGEGERGEVAAETGFARKGFQRVIPGGAEQILFILGLALLGGSWRHLLTQVLGFAAAHSITLIGAALGWIQADVLPVGELTALSLVAVALANLLHPHFSAWRLALVSGFGLVHGVALAAPLRMLGQPTAAGGTALSGYFAGVEGGLLLITLAAFALLLVVRDSRTYRKFVAIPGSVLVTAVGLWWMAERLLGEG